MIMKMKYNRTILSLFACVALLVCGCAKEGYPSGGPKDTTPPKVLATQPSNGAAHFAAKEYSIAFDEYVSVKDAENNILVSPPMKHKPEFTTRGRSVVVKIKDTLLANTTYLFQFKGGIVDFNEGNVLESFEYVFSTGAAIDSMTIRGRVLDAFSLNPREEVVTVVAYSQQQLAEYDSLCLKQDTTPSLMPKTDSVVAYVQPMYITRCNKDGSFELNHLRQGQYLLLALEDGDKNLRLGVDEAVAFLDTLVVAQHMPAAIDTLPKSDSSVVAQSDSMAQLQYSPITPVSMNMSHLKREVQRVLKAEFSRRGQLSIITAVPLSHQFSLRPLSASASLYLRISPTRDTISAWTASQSCDSISLVLWDTNYCDTLSLQFQSHQKSASQKSSSSIISQVSAHHPFFDTLWIAFGNPISHLAHSAADSVVAVTNLTDSSVTYCGVRLIDTCMPRGYWRAMIDFRGKPGIKYQLRIPPRQFYDIYDHLNTDSLIINTEFTKAEDYGNIIVSANIADTVPTLLQLISEDGKTTFRQYTITHDTTLSFLHLKAGKYRIRAIEDTNHDGIWTPGDYYCRRQPERVVYFDKTLDLRANWDMEERWEVKFTE